MEGISILYTIVEIYPSSQFKKGVNQIALAAGKDDRNDAKSGIPRLSIESSLNLFAKPTLRSVSADAYGTASCSIETLSHFLLPVLSGYQYPLIQPDRQLRLVSETGAKLLDRRAVNVCVTEKHVEGLLSFHVVLPSS